jgi:hypothetical protein
LLVLKTRLAEEGNQLLTNCKQLKMTAADGKERLTDVASQIKTNRRHTLNQKTKFLTEIPLPTPQIFSIFTPQMPHTTQKTPQTKPGCARFWPYFAAIAILTPPPPLK